MKSLLTTVLLILSFTFVVNGQSTRRATPIPNPAAELKKAERDFFDALVSRDAAKLNLVLATDFREVDTDGTLIGKKDFLAYIGSTDFSFESITGRDFEVRVYGLTAVVNGISTYTRKGKTFPDMRHTGVWVKRLGRWQVVSWQSVALKVKGKRMTTESGLQYEDLVEGKGASPATGRTVTVHYTGTFENGTKFDSSVDRGTPFQFQIGNGQVIRGWDEGVMTMKVGGKRKLIIPPHLGYGTRGVGPIPPNATLYFEVELLAVD